MEILTEYKNNIISCFDIYNSNVKPNVADIILEFMFLDIFPQTKKIVKKLLFWMIIVKPSPTKEMIDNRVKNYETCGDFNYDYKADDVQVYTRDKIIELINFVSDINNWTLKEEGYEYHQDYITDIQTDMLNKVLPDIFQTKSSERFDFSQPKFFRKYLLDCYYLIKLPNKN